MMKRSSVALITALAVTILVASLAAEAQQPKNVPRIGFLASLARPGGNITGLSTLSPEISGKQLELLQEIVPSLLRVAVLGNALVPGNAQVLRETETTAQAFRVQLQYIDVPGPQDIETAFREASQARADAVLVLNNPVVTAQRTQAADLAVKSRLPAIYLARA